MTSPHFGVEGSRTTVGIADDGDEFGTELPAENNGEEEREGEAGTAERTTAL
jgi:hypothetical protein